MIDIKELSVGNWVYAQRMTKKPVQIEGIIEKEGYGSKGYTFTLRTQDNVLIVRERRQFIEPIPITPEILEKNGGFYPKGSTWMKLDNHCRELWICKHTDGTYWLYSSGDCDKDENFAEIRYVHQLQNALTLCGINKEIRL